MAEASAAATRSLSPESVRPRRRKIVPRCDCGAHPETARSSATCAVDLIGRTGTHTGRNGHGAPTSRGRSGCFSNRVACLTPGTQANDLEHTRRLGATECSFWCAVDGHAGRLPRCAYRRISRVARTPELSQSVTERVRLLQNAAADYRGRLIETLSTACGRLYAEQVTRSATPGYGRGLRTSVYATSETDTDLNSLLVASA